MSNQFMISKSLFNFLVTISTKSVKVETCTGSEYTKAFINTSVKTQELIINRYLRRYQITQNIFSEVMSFYSQRLWTITEVSQDRLEENEPTTKGYSKIKRTHH
ncbi:MAG: hypothetical protein JWQ09_2854 [Segetibacter sp.]|nr:hypothetical protein [Segetibacter sp.]